MTDTSMSHNASTVDAVPDVMDPIEAGRYLRLPESSIRALLRSGKLPGAKLGALWRIRRCDLDAMFTPVMRTAPPACAAVALPSVSLPPCPPPVLAPRPLRPGRPRKPARGSRTST